MSKLTINIPCDIEEITLRRIHNCCEEDCEECYTPLNSEEEPEEETKEEPEEEPKKKKKNLLCCILTYLHLV
jgi:hypothetical protein